MRDKQYKVTIRAEFCFLIVRRWAPDELVAVAIAAEDIRKDDGRILSVEVEEVD